MKILALLLALLTPSLLGPRVTAAIIFVNGPRAVAAGATTEAAPIFANYLTGVASTTGATSYATSSVTATSNALVLAVVINSKASAPDTPTITGWTQIATGTFNTIASPTERLTVFRRLDAAPSAGAITADFAGATQTGCMIEVGEFQNADTSGTNGSGAIVQATAIATNNASTNPTVTYTAPSDSANAMAFFYGDSVSSATDSTPPSGWTEWEELNYATPSTGGAFHYNLHPTGTSVTATATSRAWAAIVIEIKPKQKTIGQMIASTFVDYSGSTATAIPNTTTLATGTHGLSNGWTTTPNPLTTITYQTSPQARLHDVVVGSTTYTAGADTRRLKYDNSVASQVATIDISDPGASGTAQHNNNHAVSVGMWLTIGTLPVSGGGQLTDLLVMQEAATGGACALQVHGGTGALYYLNLETNPGGVTTHSTDTIPFTQNATYWCCVLFDLDRQLAYANVYDTSGVLFGTIRQSGANVTGWAATRFVGNVNIGNLEADSSATTNYLGPVVINLAGTFPFGP